MLNDLKPAGTATNLLLSMNIIKLIPIKSFMSIAIPKFLWLTILLFYKQNPFGFLLIQDVIENTPMVKTGNFAPRKREWKKNNLKVAKPCHHVRWKLKMWQKKKAKVNFIFSNFLMNVNNWVLELHFAVS